MPCSGWYDLWLFSRTGQTMLEYERLQLDENDGDARKLINNGDKMLHEGYISLQAESHPVEFRKMEILPLDQ